MTVSEIGVIFTGQSKQKRKKTKTNSIKSVFAFFFATKVRKWNWLSKANNNLQMKRVLVGFYDTQSCLLFCQFFSHWQLGLLSSELVIFCHNSGCKLLELDQLWLFVLELCSELLLFKVASSSLTLESNCWDESEKKQTSKTKQKTTVPQICCSNAPILVTVSSCKQLVVSTSFFSFLNVFWSSITFCFASLTSFCKSFIHLKLLSSKHCCWNVVWTSLDSIFIFILLHSAFCVFCSFSCSARACCSCSNSFSRTWTWATATVSASFVLKNWRFNFCWVFLVVFVKTVECLRQKTSTFLSKEAHKP